MAERSEPRSPAPRAALERPRRAAPGALIERPGLRALLGLLLVVYELLALPLLALALLLLPTAETLAGHLFAAYGLCLLALPALIGRALLARRPRRWLVVAGAGVAAAVLLVALALLAPRGSASPSPGARSTVASHYLRDPYRRLATTNLLPEIDQIKLGTYLVPLVDRHLDQAAARRLRGQCMALYRELERDHALRALGSAMGYAYSDSDGGHLYEAVPAHPAGERLPAVVFLHGSFGNFKAYLHLWRRMAEAGRFLVVAPSFGFGNWNRPGGTAAVERARQRALALGADPARVYLAGLSNGGRGVTRVLAGERVDARRYAGVILLSAVIEPEVIAEARLGWRGLPVLVMHGQRDDRIPWPALEEGVQALRAAAAEVTLLADREEDHFLFFARPAQVQGWVEGWLRARR